MARGLNKVLIIGTLGRDAELKYTPNGTAVASMRIAATESFATRDGQRQERTEWFNVVAYSKLAEIAGEYCRKGRQVFIEGRLQTRNYEDKQGQKRYITEVIANQMLLLGGRQREDILDEAPEDSGNGTSRKRQGKSQYSDEPRFDDYIPPEPDYEPGRDFGAESPDDEVPF